MLSTWVSELTCHLLSDSLYEQTESSALHPRELYISTSKIILDPSDALVKVEVGTGQDLNSTILMIVKKADGEFKSINTSPSSAQIKKFCEGMDTPAPTSSSAKKTSEKPSGKVASTSKVATKAPTTPKTKSKKTESVKETPKAKPPTNDKKRKVSSPAAEEGTQAKKKTESVKETPKPKSPTNDKKRKDSTPATKEGTQAKKTKVATPSIEEIDESVKVPTRYALFCADHKEGNQLVAFGTDKPSTREFRIAYERLSKEEMEEYEEKIIDLKRQGTIDKNRGLIAPKRPKTSYNLFCDDIKKKNLAEDPNARTLDGKELGAKYKEISAEEKKKYEAKATALRTKYNDEMAEFKKKKGDGEDKSETDSNDKKRKQRDPDAPTRPLTSFMLFCTDFRAEVKKMNPKAGSKEIAEILGEKYTELGKKDQEEKQKYEQRASDLMKKYKENLAVHDEKQGNEDDEKGTDDKDETKSTKKSKKRKSKKKDPNAPKRPLSSFMLFCSDVRKDVNKKNPNLGPNDIAKLLGKKYRELSKKKLESYKKQAEKLKTKYDKDVEKYNKAKNDAEESAKGGDDKDKDGESLVI